MLPRRDVKRLPDIAESIFCPADISIPTSCSSSPLIVTDFVVDGLVDNLSCLWLERLSGLP